MLIVSNCIVGLDYANLKSCGDAHMHVNIMHVYNGRHTLEKGAFKWVAWCVLL